MQKSKTLYFKPRNFYNLIKEGYPFLIMFLMYIIGIIFGVFLYREEPIVADAVLKKFNSLEEAGSFWKVFAASLSSWLPFLILILIFGLCVVGVALIPLSLLLKGMEYGALAGFLYSTYSLSGVVYVLILVIPSSMIAAFALFFMSQDSFRFSLKLLRHIMPEPRGEFLHPHFIKYCKRFFLFLFIIVIAVIIEATLKISFSEIIKLV